jgi:hypothetical protein
MITDHISPVFKSLVWDVMIKSAIGKMVALFALSPTGIVATILSGVVLKIADQLYPVFEKTVKVGEIKLSNEIHQKIYDIANYKLKIIAIEKGINSDEFKKQRDIEHNKLLNAVTFNI